MSRPDLQVLLRPATTFPALAHRLLWGRGSSLIVLEGQLRTAGASVYPIPGLPLRILPARSCGTFLGLAHHGLPVFPSSARAGDRGFEPDANRSLSIGNGTGRRLRTFKYRQASSSSSQPHCSRIGLTRPTGLRGVKPCFRFEVGGPANTNRLRGASQASRGRGLFPVAPRHNVVDRAGKLDLRGSSHAHSLARVCPPQTGNRA